MSFTKKQIVKSVFWSAIERFSVQGVQFILMLIIARFVLPSEYGLVAMLGIFLSIAQTFVDSGFYNALIQKKDRTETDYHTVFYFNMVVALLVYTVLFCASSYISAFYREPRLELVTKCIGLSVVFSSLSIVQRAKLAINLDFQTLTKVSLFSVVVSGIAGVWLAYHEYGVWALVVQTLLNSSLGSVLLWIVSRWVPRLVFSWDSFRTLFSFGSKLMLSGLLHNIYINLYSLVIGRTYSAVDVGFYNRASAFAQFPSTNIVSIISRVAYPIQCQLQDDDEKLKNSFITYLRLSCFIVFPLMVLLAVLAKPLIAFLLTEKWLPAANLLSILCIAYMWYPVSLINNHMLNVKGRSDYFLKAEIYKKIIAVLILIFTLPFGVEVLCLGILVYNFFDMAIVIAYVKKVLATSYKQQITELFPLILLSIGMGGIIFISVSCFDNNLLKIIIGGAVGLISYFLLAVLFRFRELLIVKNIFK